MKYLLTLIPLSLLVACSSEERVINGDDLQNGGATAGADAYQDQYGEMEGLNPNAIMPNIQGESDRIVLSDFSQEQQQRDRAEYARQLDLIEANRVEITGATVAEVDTSVNVAAYARSTSNQVGQRVYSRSGKRGNCRAYGSGDAAQRAFLSHGGPSNDTLGLDSDGDGFACDFDPQFYRRLSY